MVGSKADLMVGSKVVQMVVRMADAKAAQKAALRAALSVVLVGKLVDPKAALKVAQMGDSTAES